jgi:hypothetical protein
LIPYSNGNEKLYNDETLKSIKEYILALLRSKQSNLHMSVLKLLQKHTILQKEPEIWERLESLLNNSTQAVKKEILKLLEIDNQNILKYLLEMYDDDSAEIRHFVFEKLSEIKDFGLIDARTKVKLLYIGLSDSNLKVQNSAKKFLKNFLFSLGIYNTSNKDQEEPEIKDEVDQNDKMEVETPNAEEPQKTGKKGRKKKDTKEEEEVETAQERILKATSPLKTAEKKKLKDSPSRVFDNLDIILYYNHAKYSYAFQLITEAIIEFTDHSNLVEFIQNIVDNMILISDCSPELKFHPTMTQASEMKRKKGAYASSLTKSSMLDKFAFFNDVYFLQNTIRIILTRPRMDLNLKDQIMQLLPDNKTYSRILSHFYKKETNVMILHQLLLLSFNLSCDDEVGNREMQSFLKQFISDLSLDTKQISDNLFKSRRLNFTTTQSVEEQEEVLDENKFVSNCVENVLLPHSRRMVFSMEDLLDHALRIFHKLHAKESNALFISIMDIIHEINEPLEAPIQTSQLVSMENGISVLKKQQLEILEKIKEQLNIIAGLEEQRKGGKNRMEIDRKLKTENLKLDELDEQLYTIAKEERNILTRVLKLCEFLIKYCKVPVQSNYK